MDITIYPGKLSGTIESKPSKSQLHRLLICAAISDADCHIRCNTDSGKDIAATVDCLCALGAQINRTADGYEVKPINHTVKKADLYCHESGSTLRFLLPIVGALGVDATFHMKGRLPYRPISPLWEEMNRMGCTLTRPTPDTIRCQGKLRSGCYRIPGNISSQFISGLLFAFSLMPGNPSVEASEPIESSPYIEMTVDTLRYFHSRKPPYDPVLAEGDWSCASSFIAANSLGCAITVTGLNPNSIQGDRVIAEYASALHTFSVIDCSNIPDIVPTLAVLAAANRGSQFTGIHRLRLKESDRVNSTVCLINSLGGTAFADANTIHIAGTGLSGGHVDSCNDHRIAMAAAVAATVCTNAVTISGAECVEKSYPDFWTDYARLGGNYEFNLRN